MSLDYIVNNAILNAWCNPEQDMQSVVEPKRITRMVGVFGQFEAGKAVYALPDHTSRFHIFQIGQLYPILMGLLSNSGVWTLMSDTCMQENLIVDIYDIHGYQMPRTQTWYMVTSTKNLLIAVKEVPTIPVDMRTSPIYLRFYTNAYFQSTRADNAVDSIKIKGFTPKTNEDILAIMNGYKKVQKLPGAVYAFVNGKKVNNLNLFSVVGGDYVEYVYDSSIEKIVDYPLSDLRAFHSDLDSMQKYLLHYPGQGQGTIDYQDDLDFFICQHGRGTQHKGVYYHRNAKPVPAVRMVTHKDYALIADSVNAYVANHPEWDLSKVFIRCHVRKSGYQRPLIDEANRIKEMYKMNDSDVLDAMLSADAVVPEWTATNLENSGYAAIMQSSTANMQLSLVERGYGYNAISKLLGDTPMFTHLYSKQNVIDVPYGLQQRAVAYEYDKNGLLLGYYQHYSGAVYSCTNATCVLVEMIAGVMTELLDDVYGTQDSVVDLSADYRFYMCNIEVDGFPNNNWVDVTGTNAYGVAGNTLHWSVNPALKFPMVRSNKNVLAYSLDLDNTEGLLFFSFTQLADRNGSISKYVLQVSMGELDVWMNGHSLIEGLDYYVKFPEITIVNKKFLNKTGHMQHIDIRFTGFCKSDMSREKSPDNGFVAYGLLSQNNRYDIRDDKVQRIVVGGAVMERSQLLFAESGGGVMVPNALNGTPYAIRDVVVPLRGLTTSDTYDLRAISTLTDTRISDYLTEKLPEVEPTTPNTIPSLYPVISPFATKILTDLVQGDLDDPRIKAFYNDADVFDICKPYEYLLAFDPTQDGLRPDPAYVVIYPHHLDTVIDVSLYHYKFMNRIVKLYLNDRVNLTAFLRLSA